MEKQYISTRNACKLCAPLGASVALKGIEGCVPLIHGSQGCATYIRRYMISHYKEPVDIASSNFSEAATVYGGSRNFITGINNIIKQYNPKVIGIASTCLSETIGEDLPGLIRDYKEANKDKELPAFINVSTASYCGSHIDGFHNTLLAAIKSLATDKLKGDYINIFPGFVSPADIRYLKEILDDFGIKYILFPDYSETLDNEHWKDYQLIPQGGTPLSDIMRTGGAKATIEFGNVFNKGAVKSNSGKIQTAGEWLENEFGVKNYQIGMPIGIRSSDSFFNILSEISKKSIPEKHRKERGRLIDAYVDAHKYVFGKRAMIFGEEDLVLSLAGFLKEIGIEPALIGSGGNSGLLKSEVEKLFDQTEVQISVLSGSDFETMREQAEELKPDILLGNSKGYYIARERKIPLVRLGFPIHDRFGAARLHHIGYRGTQELFDRIVNALIEYKQENSPVGYKYI